MMTSPKQLDWIEQIADEEAQMEAIEEYRSDIGRAISYWSKGKHIPLSLYSELMENGYDVPALEARYFKID